MNRTVRRRLATLVTAASALVVTWVSLTLLLAAPAGADTPAGWPDADNGDPLRNVLLLAGVPIGLFVLIGLAVYVPALVRGERVTPGATAPENEWLGGPRRSAGELAGPDTDESEAGGASGRW